MLKFSKQKFKTISRNSLTKSSLLCLFAPAARTHSADLCNAINFSKCASSFTKDIFINTYSFCYSCNLRVKKYKVYLIDRFHVMAVLKKMKIAKNWFDIGFGNHFVFGGFCLRSQ